MHLAVIIVYKLVVTRCGSEEQWGGGKGHGRKGREEGKGGVVEVMGKI